MKHITATLLATLLIATSVNADAVVEDRKKMLSKLEVWNEKLMEEALQLPMDLFAKEHEIFCIKVREDLKEWVDQEEFNAYVDEYLFTAKPIQEVESVVGDCRSENAGAMSLKVGYTVMHNWYSRSVIKLIDAHLLTNRCLSMHEMVWQGQDPESGTSISTILKFEVDVDFYSDEKNAFKRMSDLDEKDPRLIEYMNAAKTFGSFTKEEESYYSYKIDKLDKAERKMLMEDWQTDRPEVFHKEYIKCLDTAWGLFLQ